MLADTARVLLLKFADVPFQQWVCEHGKQVPAGISGRLVACFVGYPKP